MIVNGWLVIMQTFARKPYSAREAEYESRMEDALSDLGIAQVVNLIHTSSLVPYAVRHLYVPVGRDPIRAAKVVVRLLEDVYRVSQREGLKFQLNDDRPN
jgi:hypothetical protein